MKLVLGKGQRRNRRRRIAAELCRLLVDELEKLS